ncbi:hypothetical protein AC579_3496 [Pseudocercospora musae]|uniref:Uncharacterized protein n=1 Tax=Pseudocercospora musae TaxID=113226 RepID=A0A139I3B2_9PEZI|nr:hypothetical protein AC579_3496 [Pseudocercospora musae]
MTSIAAFRRMIPRRSALPPDRAEERPVNSKNNASTSSDHQELATGIGGPPAQQVSFEIAIARAENWWVPGASYDRDDTGTELLIRMIEWQNVHSGTESGVSETESRNNSSDINLVRCGRAKGVQQGSGNMQNIPRVTQPGSNG